MFFFEPRPRRPPHFPMRKVAANSLYDGLEQHDRTVTTIDVIDVQRVADMLMEKIPDDPYDPLRTIKEQNDQIRMALSIILRNQLQDYQNGRVIRRLHI